MATGCVFHPAGPPHPSTTSAPVVAVVVQRRIDRLLQRRGLRTPADEGGVNDPWTDEAPVLAGLAAASVQGRIAFGPMSGTGVARYGGPPEERPPVTFGPCHAGTLAASTCTPGSVVRAGERGRASSGSVATRSRPAGRRTRACAVDADGHVWVALRHQWADGTTHLRFDPCRAPGRAWPCSVPRPRINLVLDYGVLAPRAARGARPSSLQRDRQWSDVAARDVCPTREDVERGRTRHGGAPARRPVGRRDAADVWPRRTGVSALWRPLAVDRPDEQARIADRILRHLGLPTDRPEPRPAQPRRTPSSIRSSVDSWDST